MADEHRRQGTEARTAVVEEDVPTSATDAYTRKAAELRREEGRLADLQQRQARGERLTSEERLDQTASEHCLPQCGIKPMVLDSRKY